jgi:PIN domain nuclease of toxin-antitoxin system
MRLLFDTHTFIWWDSAPHKLSPRVLALCQDSTNTLILSVVSVWEMHIKSQAGKLSLRLPLSQIIEDQHNQSNIEILPVLLPQIYALDTLPQLHKDPFDRLLIAQAIAENLTLLSKDATIIGYPITVVW